MKIAEFDSMIAKAEGKKVSVSMANIREVRSLINKALKGKLNQIIKGMSNGK